MSENWFQFLTRGSEEIPNKQAVIPPLDNSKAIGHSLSMQLSKNVPQGAFSYEHSTTFSPL